MPGKSRLVLVYCKNIDITATRLREQMSMIQGGGDLDSGPIVKHNHCIAPPDRQETN